MAFAHEFNRHREHAELHGPPSRGVALTVLAGLAALTWLLFRSGSKASRLSYPCQQAALSSAVAAFGVPLVGVLLGARFGLARFLRSKIGKTTAGFLAGLTLAWGAVASYRFVTVDSPNSSTSDYQPQVYHVPNVRGVEPGRFGGVDDLVSLMGAFGLKLHRSAVVDRSSGPDGLVDADDVVLIKVNAQWSQRGGTNTDVLRGLIRCLVEHPDGFVGEVVVADNGQGSGSLARAENNAEDIHQSVQDVVDGFASEGWTVSTRLWDSFRTISVGEYATGDMNDGYVINQSSDPETAIRVSYPKFRTTAGTFVSYRDGVWDPATSSYDPERLVVINVPVLKTHVIYSVTASVKNHMGVITQSLGTDSHAGVARGGLGSVLAEVRMPDLTLLDCVWVLARPGQGPAAPYSAASRRDELVAGRDPVALDAWAVKYILMPQIVANGYTPSQYGATQDPDNPQSTFRRYLDRSMEEMLLGGIMATSDYASVELLRWAGDVDRDGDLDLVDFVEMGACLSGPGTDLEPPCQPFEFTNDAHTDLRDFSRFQSLFTGT